MSENHILGFLERSPRSIAYYSVKSPKNLIIFVHGFAGHPINTWGDFKNIIKNFSEFAQSDVIFYKYSSLKHHMASSALEFYHCLTGWVTPPKILDGLGREEAQYNKIILVSHSLGALIVRQALLFANNDNQDWVQNTKMILFAPAHKGARIIELSLKCLPGLLSIFGLVAHLYVPVLGDLKEGSEPIKEIIKINEGLIISGKGDFTKAFLSVHAINDNIIIGGLYCQDPTPIPDLEHDHITLCKPDIFSFKAPIEYLLSALK
jgi:hypothetical protein